MKLNGEDYRLGDVCYSIGMDMQCRPCVTECRILNINENDDKVVIESEGIKILIRCNDLDDFYVASVKNRNMLSEVCRKEMDEWPESIR